MDVGGVQISWLGHAGFMLAVGEKVIYIDPYEIGRTRPDADYILITHEHYDHLSVEDIDTIITDQTVLIAPESARSKLDDLGGVLKTVKRGDELELDDFVLEAVGAYNVDKKFHPDENGWVGYVLDFDGTRVYHAGDTDLIDEMDSIAADVALLPVSGTYVMTAEQAAKALSKLDVKQAVPMHYGSIVGDESDAEQFKKLAPKGVKVTILEKE